MLARHFDQRIVMAKMMTLKAFADVFEAVLASIIILTKLEPS